MKTLSVRQPWADLIMRGIKDIENRSWTTSYRGPLLIHASKTFVPGPAVAAFYGHDHQWEQGGIIGTVDLVDVVTVSDSQWAQRDGQTFHWVLANPQRAPFVPMNGKLNLYETPWPSATPPAPAHRRDERVPAEDDIEIDGDDVAAVEVVARALSRARFFEIANELLNDMPSDHEEAILDFVASLECNFHDVLAVMTLEDMNLVLKHVGQQPHADVESAAAALALAIATEDDFSDVGEYIVAIRTRFDVRIDGDGVELLTMHRAKGLEYDGVLVISPDDIIAEAPGGERVLYVALTRATQRMSVVDVTSTTAAWRSRLT